MANLETGSDMKCVIVQQNFTGKRELKVTTTPKPPLPADGEVLIAVKAWYRLAKMLIEAMIDRSSILFFCSGLNFNDVLVRYGLLEEAPRPPFIPGFECSGEVLDIGPNVTHVGVGYTNQYFSRNL